MRPFSSEQFTGWMGYRDFCDGPIPQLGSHFIDLVHYITGAKYPESAVAQGGTFTWKDRYQFTAPDHVEATWIYPEGFMVSYTSNHGNSGGNTFSIFGDQGVMDLLDWDAPTVAGTGVYPGKKTTLGEKTPVVHISRPDHFLDWLQCIRSRNTPVASDRGRLWACRSGDHGRQGLRFGSSPGVRRHPQRDSGRLTVA